MVNWRLIWYVFWPGFLFALIIGGLLGLWIMVQPEAPVPVKTLNEIREQAYESLKP